MPEQHPDIISIVEVDKLSFFGAWNEEAVALSVAIRAVDSVHEACVSDGGEVLVGLDITVKWFEVFISKFAIKL